MPAEYFAEDAIAMDRGTHDSLLAVSQGTHFVLPHSFLSGTTALMIPKTADGRVLFAIPWHGATIVGTTDEPVDRVSIEPRALDSENNFCSTTSRAILAAGPMSKRY